MVGQQQCKSGCAEGIDGAHQSKSKYYVNLMKFFLHYRNETNIINLILKKSIKEVLILMVKFNQIKSQRKLGSLNMDKTSKGLRSSSLL